MSEEDEEDEEDEEVSYGPYTSWDDFEIDGNEAIVYADGKEIDRVDLDSLVQNYLEDVVKEFKKKAKKRR